jgi:molybdopterin molybdotransferase
VAVICTGEELRQVHDRVASHEIRDSNGPLLLAALEERGFGSVSRSVVRDEAKAIARRLQAALRACQVAIVTGGVSVGRYDFVPEAVRRIGGRVRFHGVNMKPGRPQLYATLGGNRHIFALPGNPVSVLTGFHELVLPGLRRLCGAAARDCRPSTRLPLAETVRSKGERTCFDLGRMIQTRQGPAVAPIRSTGSADLIAGCAADGAIVVPAGVREIPAGGIAEFHAWKQEA